MIRVVCQDNKVELETIQRVQSLLCILVLVILSEC